MVYDPIRDIDVPSPAMARRPSLWDGSPAPPPPAFEETTPVRPPPRPVSHSGGSLRNLLNDDVDVSPTAAGPSSNTSSVPGAGSISGPGGSSRRGSDMTVSSAHDEEGGRPHISKLLSDTAPLQRTPSGSSRGDRDREREREVTPRHSSPSVNLHPAAAHHAHPHAHAYHPYAHPQHPQHPQYAQHSQHPQHPQQQQHQRMSRDMRSSPLLSAHPLSSPSGGYAYDMAPRDYLSADAGPSSRRSSMETGARPMPPPEPPHGYGTVPPAPSSGAHAQQAQAQAHAHRSPSVSVSPHMSHMRMPTHELQRRDSRHSDHGRYEVPVPVPQAQAHDARYAADRHELARQDSRHSELSHQDSRHSDRHELARQDSRHSDRAWHELSHQDSRHSDRDRHELARQDSLHSDSHSHSRPDSARRDSGRPASSRSASSSHPPAIASSPEPPEPPQQRPQPVQSQSQPQSQPQPQPQPQPPQLQVQPAAQAPRASLADDLVASPVVASPVVQKPYEPREPSYSRTLEIPITDAELSQLRQAAVQNNPLRRRGPRAARPAPQWSGTSPKTSTRELEDTGSAGGSGGGSAERERNERVNDPSNDRAFEDSGVGHRRPAEDLVESRDVQRRRTDYAGSYTGNVAEVAGHYNMRPEVGVEHREYSPIIGLKKFNNWVKSVLIGKYAYRKQGEPGANVLDIGCGKGGDLNKWKQARISLYVGMDIASTSIDQARERWKTMRGNKFDGFFYAHDCFSKPISEVLPKELQRQMYDNVSMQFCMHYAFETAQKARMMIENVSRFLRRGGVFVGTIPNSELLLQRLEEVPEDEEPRFGNTCYAISFKERRHKGLYGHEYSFFLEDAVEDVPEYIVNWKNFVSLANEYGLDLIYERTFNDILQEEQGSRDFGPLLGRMGVVDSNGVSAMDSDQWEAANLYMAFAFRKNR